MNHNTNFFENLKVWPVRIFMPSKTGYSLWGQGHRDAEDVLLHVNDNIMLLKSLDDLCYFIKNDGKKCLTIFREYEKISVMVHN
jgi:hypothetical protein